MYGFKRYVRYGYIKMKQSKTTLSKTSYFCVKFVNDF